MLYIKKILVTGGAGFIGSNLINHLVLKYPDYLICCVDSLTYAGNLENLQKVENQPNFCFEKADIADESKIKAIFEKYKIDSVIHLAAESHVDRSIHSPTEFIRTNVLGTSNLLIQAKASWEDLTDKLFYHVSTDEVYGSLGKTGLFKETTPYDPRSPYSASKAASDHIVRAFFHTYHFPIRISNCSNNYGPFQFPEKLIPLVINNIIKKKEIPVYGDGMNVRDWLYVQDHVEAIDKVFHVGTNGETYNVGGNNELTNIELVRLMCNMLDKKLHRPPGSSESLITFVKDRPGHDRRYAIDASKIKNELDWEPRFTKESGLNMTLDWYLNNKTWLENVTSGAYQRYYEEQYS